MDGVCSILELSIHPAHSLKTISVSNGGLVSTSFSFLFSFSISISICPEEGEEAEEEDEAKHGC
jgi:hypothetical protein